MHRLLYILIFLIISANAIADNNRVVIDENIALFIEKESGEKIDISQLKVHYIKNNKDTLIALYYNKNLFVAYNCKNHSNPILAYSFQNGIEDSEVSEQAKFFDVFYKDIKEFSYPSKQKSSVTAVIYGPLLQSQFGQTNCHSESGSIINVTNIYTPQNVAVGCVAISMATVFDYNNWPIHGSGENTYTDSWGSLTGEHYANFEDEYYEWDNILNEYNYKATNYEQRKALGRLAYHSAVALEMDFEYGGSTSNINKFPSVFRKYFKHYGEYESNTSNFFFDNIDSMIIKNSIVPLAVSGNGYAHSVVCDGWQITDKGNKYYHLNMGWWGTTNGWYQIQDDFNAGGYSSVDGGVFNIVPTPDINVETDNEVFTIQWETPSNFNIIGYNLQIKKGRARWTTLADLTDETSYQTENDGETSYAFRVRMKYVDFPDIEAWSNVVIFDNDKTGVLESKSVTEVNIYPNPVKNILSIDCEKCNDNLIVEIFDIFGKKYKTIYFSSLTNMQINVSDLQNGTYIIRLSDSKDIFRQIFIKK